MASAAHRLRITALAYPISVTDLVLFIFTGVSLAYRVFQVSIRRLMFEYSERVAAMAPHYFQTHPHDYKHALL
jgi:hypothetical protein